MQNKYNKLNDKITINSELIHHSKASETYISVTFEYPNSVQDWWIPVEYRRTGLHLESLEEIEEYLNLAYNNLNPNNYNDWLKQQEKFWETKPKALVTKSFFDKLKCHKWICVMCNFRGNPNWARRVQDLKEFGYTIATNTNKTCFKCNEKRTHLLLVPLVRGNLIGNGYETWSPKLRNKILKVLEYQDVYEVSINKHILPDHKFPEIRWDENTLSLNDDNMQEIEIERKFQLLSNQRNQQKREACRRCYQTGERGVIYGIPYFYEGGQHWDSKIPKRGTSAELGCKGCPWYDIKEWRKCLLQQLEINQD